MNEFLYSEKLSKYRNANFRSFYRPILVAIGHIMPMPGWLEKKSNPLWSAYSNVVGHMTRCSLRSLINVGLRLLIYARFIQGYFVIREAIFINFQFFIKVL